MRYGGRVVVARQEVTVFKGLSCVLGPSGLGKSTFLRALESVLKWPYVPQEIKFPYGRVWELAAHLSRLNECCDVKTYLSNFVEVLEELGMGKEYLERNVKTLSSGEKQRVALALQLARGCGALLADEPTSQLDFESSTRVMKSILKRTVAAVVVTHDPLALSECERTYTLRGGFLVREELPFEPGCLRGCFKRSRPS